MKVILCGTSLALLMATTAQAGLLSSIRSSDWETKSTSHYMIDTMNFNVRVYEFTPNDNKNIRCVFFAGNQNSSGASCYHVESSKIK